ncbi:LAMI_0G09626g1_1 [Lachancea mirantina]|uniref:LAMI_0G09626g1_1 n=1 Tax=Lachancea mirantina TaxID=1230905 RepID=A0A1G4KAC8_9SACH|nr:LAMI_0G09626g1_1 [Lachancea mirantina]
MSNILHKVSEKLSGHDHDKQEETDEYGNPLTGQQQEYGREFKGGSGREYYTRDQESSDQTLPSQHQAMGGRDVHSHGQQSWKGGQQQQRHDMEQEGGNFDMFEQGEGVGAGKVGSRTRGSMGQGQGQGQGQRQQQQRSGDWGDDDDFSKNRDEDYADEFQKRYW